MTHNPAHRRAAEARALAAALAVANRAGWHLTRTGAALSATYGNYLYAYLPELLLVPTSAGVPFAARLADGAVREARSDALVVSAAGPEIAFALALWSSAGTRWQVPVVPWLGTDEVLWMVTGENRAPGGAGGTAFPLRARRLVDEPAPWATARERAAGEERAARWLASVMV